MFLIYLVLFYLNWNIKANGFPNGAPWDTCLTMFPKHGGRQQQTGLPPFQVVPNVTQYAPGDTLTLTINASTPGHTLKGIQIRARPRGGDTERIVGLFTSWPDKKTHPLDCLGGKQNMVTHKNNLPVQEIVLEWRAPNISVGDIEFVFSFVEDFTKFWVDETLEITGTVGVATAEVEQLSLRFEVIDWSVCGHTKGCFLYPRTCSGYDCHAAVTYRTVNNSVEFEMFGSQQGYISVGFSEDKHMGGDETVTCTADDTSIAIQRGYNHQELYNERQFKAGLFDIQGAYKDGRLYCRFSRPLSMFVYVEEGHVAQKVYDLRNEYYLMLAWGPKYEGTEVIGIHKELPPISQSKVNFRESKIIRGSSLPFSKQMHGALMLIAWIFLVGVATVVSRHFKEGFNGSVLCGTKVWFQIHRNLTVLAWLLTVASFVLIFVIMGELSENAQIHSYLGITVMSASTLQILMGLVRPKPDSNIRPVFNWGHWFLGKSTHIVAAVAFFFAFNNDMIPAPQQRFANIVLGVTVGHQVLWEICFEVNRRHRKKRLRDSYELKDMQKSNGKMASGKSDSNQVSEAAASESGLVFYTLCMLALSAVALACIFLF